MAGWVTFVSHTDCVTLLQVAARMAAPAVPTPGDTGGHSCRKQILLAATVAMVSTEVFVFVSLSLPIR